MLGEQSCKAATLGFTKTMLLFNTAFQLCILICSGNERDEGKNLFFPAAYCILCEKKKKIKLLIKQISSEGVCFLEKMSATWKTTSLKIHVLLSHCKLQYFV